MSQCSEWEYGGASAQAWGCGGIALIRSRGVVTQSVAGSILADCQSVVDAWQTRGLVAQYDEAQLDIDADTLCRSAVKVVEANGRLSLPTALVVRRDDLPMWKTYAHLMAQRGILRGVFTDYDQAMRWARTQAAIFSADPRRTPKAGQLAHRLDHA